MFKFLKSFSLIYLALFNQEFQTFLLKLCSFLISLNKISRLLSYHLGSYLLTLTKQCLESFLSSGWSWPSRHPRPYIEAVVFAELVFHKKEIVVHFPKDKDKEKALSYQSLHSFCSLSSSLHFTSRLWQLNFHKCLPQLKF